MRNPPNTAQVVEQEEPEAVDQPELPAAAEQQVGKEQRVALLSSITTSPVIGSGMEAFLPRDMMQVIEFSKMMAGGRFVPPHLRGMPGDCMAVILQAMRWRADPFAVASKTYFVNDRMAYEAQMVNAVLNTSSVLSGRLQITWQGKINTPDFQCTVRGRIKGDDEVHELLQEFGTIKTKNSPLWQSSPRIQIGYYTSRGWGRLFTPEVMLGIYTPDEIEDGMGDDAPIIGQQIIEPKTYSIPPRPTRDDAKSEAAAAERTRKEQVGNEGHHRTIMREEAPRTQPAHDAETGEVTDGATTESEAEQARQEPATDYTADADALLTKIKNVGMRKGLDTLIAHSGPFLDTLKVENLDLWNKVQESIGAKKKWFER